MFHDVECSSIIASYFQGQKSSTEVAKQMKLQLVRPFHFLASMQDFPSWKATSLLVATNQQLEVG